MLNAPINVHSFRARGEIRINQNLLSYDIQNGIASFRFIKKENKDSNIATLSNKWTEFEDYYNLENGNYKDLFWKFYAYLSYGYNTEHELCFYVHSIIDELYKENIYIIDIFSPCLIDHFEDATNFDFNDFGYVDDTPCAIQSIDNAELKIYKTVAVEFNRNKINYSLSFQKKFIGGFRFEYSKPLNNNLIKHCVEAVNEYCCFLLKDNGFFITNVELVDEQNFGGRSYLYYPPEIKEIKNEILFKFDDISEIFNALLGLFLEENANFTALYNFETNIYQPIDILRIASMFENQYRKNVDAKMADYVEQENIYRHAYYNAIELKDVQGKLEKDIIAGEKARRKQSVISSLKMRLQFVFNKLLNVLGTNIEKVKDSTFVTLHDYDISNLAKTIKDARNDIAHFLEDNIDYKTALQNTYVLQLMIYYMIFERLGLPNEKIKKIILGSSQLNDWMFGIINFHLHRKSRDS